MSSITADTSFSGKMVWGAIVLSFVLGGFAYKVSANSEQVEENKKKIEKLEELPYAVQSLADAVDRLTKELDKND